MREVALFVEDYAHRQVIGALVQRVADECDVAIQEELPLGGLWYSDYLEAE